MENKHLSVYEVTTYIKEIFEEDVYLNDIYIKGEISNFTHHSSGHMYFSLKDSKAKLNCVMFRGDAISLKFKPKDGMEVLLRGRVSVYERDGKYQVYCRKMEPDGVGSLYKAYEQLKEKLYSEGLFDAAGKKSLPHFPRKIGVVTSKTGAVIKDIINVATNRFKGVEILLYPAKVQGEGAEKTIIKGIEYFNTRSDIDIIIIARGGGSIEELWAFNEESLARCIYNSDIPIISAVGHETDFTIADFVADYRASTPSHAAEIAVPSLRDLKYKTENIKEKLKRLENNLLTEKSTLVNRYGVVLEMKSPYRKIQENMQHVDSLTNKIIKSAEENILKNQNKLTIIKKDIVVYGEKNILLNKSKFDSLIGKLEVMNPLSLMKKGYSFLEKKGKIVNSIEQIEIDDEVKVNLVDGNLTCKVIDVKEGALWQEEKKKKSSKLQ